MRPTPMFGVLLVLVTLATPACQEPSGVQETEERVPSTLELVYGDQQEAVAGTELAADLVVRVLDQYDEWLAGVEVTWTATMGGGTLSPTSSVTDGQGIARSTWTLGTQTGTNAAAARVAGETAISPVNFTATATGAAAAVVEVEPKVVSLAAGATQQLTATVFDQNGSTVSNPNLTWESSSPSVATVDANGLLTAVATGSAVVTVRFTDPEGTAAVDSVAVAVNRAGDWEAPVVLFEQGDGRVTVDPVTGHIWAAGKNGSNQLVWRKSTDEGATWSAVTAVAGGTTDRMVNYGSLAVYDGVLHILTTPDPNGLTGALIYRRYVEDTDAWTSVDLTANAGGGNNYRAHRASIATDGTIVHVVNGRVFNDPDAEQDLTYHRSTDAGLTWDSSVLDENAGRRSAGNPDVALSGPYVYVVYTISDNTDPQDPADTMLLRSTDFGATWEAPVNVGENQLLRPRVVARGSNLGIVAETKANDIIAPQPRQLRWIESSDYGVTWPTTFTEFTDWSDPIGHPVVTVGPNGGIHVAGFLEAGTHPTVYYWQPWFGSGWLPDADGQVVADDNDTNGHTQPYSIAASAGYVHVILGEDFTAQSDNTVYMRRPNPVTAGG